MKKPVTIRDAKTRLSQLINRAAQGEEIIIARAGKPVAKLTAYDLPLERRKPGTWKNKVVIREDFDQRPKSFLKAFCTAQ